jgi:hypothetical protein
MNEAKLITIRVDPNLDRMWRYLGFSSQERLSELQKLEVALFDRYQSFMAETNSFVEDLRNQLRQAQADFKRTQQVYGDTTATMPLKPSQPLRDQIASTQRARAELVQTYQGRTQELEKLHREATRLFDLLGVDACDRGEFAQVGDSDITVERVGRFKETIKGLKADRDQRMTLHASLKARAVELLEELAEAPSDELQSILDERLITNRAIQVLGESIDSLEDLKARRSAEIESLSAEIEHLYAVMVVRATDRVAKQTEKTQAVVDLLRQEAEFLREQRDVRLPQVITSAKNEITKLCDDLRIPPKMRPKFTGGDAEAEAAFLTEQVQELKQKKIQCQPIFDIMSQIESCRDSITRRHSRGQGAKRGVKGAVDEDRAKRQAKELPRLEQKLLALLLQFKQQNGYEFEFYGVSGTQSLTAFELPDDALAVSWSRSHGKARPASTLGHQILMRKISDSLTLGYEQQPAHRAARSNSASRSPFL